MGYLPLQRDTVWKIATEEWFKSPSCLPSQFDVIADYAHMYELPTETVVMPMNKSEERHRKCTFACNDFEIKEEKKPMQNRCNK